MALEEIIVLALVFSLPILSLLLAIGAIYWDHKRKVKMIEKGLIPEDIESDETWWLLGIGLILFAMGTGRAITTYFQEGVLTGITLALLGIAFIAYFLIKKSFKRE